MGRITRATCIIGTAGHIDHGKTSLVRALTGMDTDRLADEKRRGVSIDLGFAYMDFSALCPAGPQAGTQGGAEGSTLRAAVVDVPGHERFIKNMLAGATGMDLVLFTVAADDGVMPQTREHLDIIRLLGVDRVVFVITKIDLADPERVELVGREIEVLLEATVLAASPVVPVSTVTGDGLERLIGVVTEQVLASKRIIGNGPFRLPIDRSFTMKGHGTVVTGTIASGTIRVGDEAILFPTGARVKVRGIQSLHISTRSAAAGERAALNITGVGQRDVERGFVLTVPALRAFSELASTGAPLVVDCTFEFGGGRGGLKDSVLKKMKPFGRRQLKVHHLTGDTLAYIRFPKGTGPDLSASCAQVAGRLVLKHPLMMLRGDRFILRDPSLNATIGGGIVRLPYPIKRTAPRLSKTVFETAPLGASLVESVRGVLSGSVPGVIDSKTLSLMLNVKEDSVSDISGFKQVGEFIVDIKKAGAVECQVMERVEAHHRDHPTEAGIDEHALFRAMKSLPDERVTRKLFDELISGLVRVGKLKRLSGAVALASHSPGLGTGDAALERRIMDLFAEPFRPPAMDELRRTSEDVDRVLDCLVKTGHLVKLKHERYLGSADVDSAREKLVSHMTSNPTISARDFRDSLGCGRKLAIEILEYFDKIRFTLRSGDVRTLR